MEREVVVVEVVVAVLVVVVEVVEKWKLDDALSSCSDGWRRQGARRGGRREMMLRDVMAPAEPKFIGERKHEREGGAEGRIVTFSRVFSRSLDHLSIITSCRHSQLLCSSLPPPTASTMLSSSPTNLLGLLVTLSLLLLALAADPSSPHPHKGVNTPFSPGPPSVTLTANNEALLLSGKPYSTQLQDGKGGRGLVVQDVAAPASVVWSRILDFDHYSDMVPRTVLSKNYRVDGREGGPQKIYTEMKFNLIVTKIGAYFVHTYTPAKRSLTWTLDYSRHSDVDDSVGFWYVADHPSKPNHSRVFYSVDVKLGGMPSMVIDLISKKALIDATNWVKKNSEIQAIAEGVDFSTGEGSQQPTKLGLLGRIKMALKKKAEPEVEEIVVEKEEIVSTATLAWRWSCIVLIVALLGLNITLFAESMYKEGMRS
jgi:hypothetical protein